MWICSCFCTRLSPAAVCRYLGSNGLAGLQQDDFCQLTSLQNLYLDSNLLTHDSISDDTFACMPVLRVLWVRWRHLAIARRNGFDYSVATACWNLTKHIKVALVAEPGSSTLYLSTSVLKYKFQSTWKVLKYISEKYHVLVLELKYILKVLRFSSTFQVHFKYFRLFYRIIFQTTKLGDWGKRFICSWMGPTSLLAGPMLAVCAQCKVYTWRWELQ